ncbi:MAG: MarR family transcriptional regulator [Oscillospiraceae bacterium]|nr:MarR family transcriptional regulator [Oscillospiraceae bacterium]
MPTDLDLLWQLRQTDVLFRRALHQHLPTDRRQGHGHGKILYLLMRSDGVSQKELAARLEIRPQSLTDALLRLEKEGLITRERSQLDKREQFVRITPLGRERAEKLHTLREQAAAEIFASLTQEEREELGRILTKTIGHFRDREQEEQHV